MGDVVNFNEYKETQEQKRRRARKKAASISKMKKAKTRRVANREFYKLVDLFLQKHYPDAFWKFDLFINGKLD